jgi:hypothetical protein
VNNVLLMQKIFNPKTRVETLLAPSRRQGDQGNRHGNCCYRNVHYAQCIHGLQAVRRPTSTHSDLHEHRPHVATDVMWLTRLCFISKTLNAITTLLPQQTEAIHPFLRQGTRQALTGSAAIASPGSPNAAPAIAHHVATAGPTVSGRSADDPQYARVISPISPVCQYVRADNTN